MYNNNLNGLNDILTTGDVGNIINLVTKACPGKDVSGLTTESVLRTAIQAQAPLLFDTSFLKKSFNDQKNIVIDKTVKALCDSLPNIVPTDKTTPNVTPAPNATDEDNTKKYMIWGGIGLAAIAGVVVLTKSGKKTKKRKR